MNCSKCGAFNNPGSTTCHNCGNSLVQNNPVNIFNQPMTQNNIAGSQPAQNNMLNQNIQPQQPVQPMVNQPFVQPQNQVVQQPAVQTVQPQQQMVQQPSVQPTQQPIQQMVNQPSSQVETTSEKKKNPAIIIIIILVLVAVGVGVFFLLKGKDGSGIGGGKRGSKNASGKAYSPEHPYESIFDTTAPVLFYHNGKYGYASEDGKVVIQAKYNGGSSFYGNIAGAYINEKNSTNYYLINREGKVLGNTNYSSDYSFDKAYGLIYFKGAIYDTNFKKLSGDYYIRKFFNGYSVWVDSTNHKTGIMDPSGKVTISFDSNEISDFVFDIGEYDIILDNMYCSIGDNKIYNCSTGKLIQDYGNRFKVALAHNGNLFYFVNGDDKQYVYVEDDKIVLTSSKDMDYYDYYIRYKDDSDGYTKYYNIINKKKYESFSELPNLAGAKKEYEKVKCDNGNSKIIKDGKEIVGCNWQYYTELGKEFSAYLYSIGKEYVIGNNYNGKNALIDLKTGKVVKEVDFDVSNESKVPIIFLKGTDTKNNRFYVYNILTGEEHYFTHPKSKIRYDSTVVYVNINKPDYVDYAYTNKFKLINKDL